MLKLLDIIDLLGISRTSLGKFKVHCATGKNPPPLEAFFDGKFKEWQEYQNHPNFQCDKILSLIHLRKDRWLFAGIYDVLGVKKHKKGKKTWFKYSTKEIRRLENLTGRVIVQFEKKFRASYLIGKKYYDKLVVLEIRDQRMSVGDFPGYNSVLISYRLLRTIVREELPSWKSALSNVSGIYIITDNKTGKHYIGSAYGGEGIWHRWVSYAKDRHGGSKELKELLRIKGEDYIQNLQLSILEVCDLNVSDEYMICRESHWKEVLRSREFGYNSN